MDQQPIDTTIAGVKVVSIILAAFGSAISLSYVPASMTRKQAILSFLSGLITSVAVTPLAMHYLGLSNGLEGGVAFLAGLSAMAAIPAAIAFVSRFRSAKVPFLPDEGDKP